MSDTYALRVAAEVERFEASVRQQQLALAEEIAQGRIAAHAKHGHQSIEAVGSHVNLGTVLGRSDRLLSILTEEVGEVATEVNDAVLGKYREREAADRLRAELVDVLTVASAWVAKLDQAKTPQERVGA